MAFTPHSGGPNRPKPSGARPKGQRPTMQNNNNKDEHRINDRIRGVKEVRLVGDNVTMGIYSIQDAMRIAEELELDLVEISATANPPVCKVMDYQKFCYQQKKKLSACGGKAKGKDWNMAEAIKFGTGVSKFVKTITVKNGVVTLTSKNTNEKDVTAELTKIYIPSPVDPKDPSKGLSWEVDAANSTCAPLGAC